MIIIDKDFPGLRFDSVWEHPQGEVLMALVSSRSMRWAVRKGASYPPERHPYGHRLTVERGCGVFSVAGEEVAYGPGQSFDVPRDTPHGFVRIDEHTVVLQEM